MSNREISKFIALILRHRPEAIGITLDEHGWANVDELIAGINRTHPFTMADLEEIVRTDSKQRYAFNEDRTLIRANQGHSVPVDVELQEAAPPAQLYHGSGEKYAASIERQGLIPKSRLYVHLSADYDTARQVGSRHGKPVVYLVEAGQMAADGFKFYRSVNGVWLTKEVPPRYLRRGERRRGAALGDSQPVSPENSRAAEAAEELKRVLSRDDIEDIAEGSIIPKYGWECVQQALFAILLDDAASEEDYQNVADLLWILAVNGYKIKKKTCLALTYYRLGNADDPYGNNTLWSLASALYRLDYCNSDYNPLKDEKILRKLAEYGLRLGDGRSDKS